MNLDPKPQAREKRILLGLAVSAIVLALTGFSSFKVVQRLGWVEKLKGRYYDRTIQRAEPVAYVNDPYCGVRFMPFTQLHWEGYGEVHETRANRDGFLDRDHDLTTPNYRIAIVGGSYAEAQQVPIEERFDSFVESSVYELSAHTKIVETMNFGISNQNTAGQFGTVVQYVKKYHPDEIWVFFHPAWDIGSSYPVLNPPPGGPYYIFGAGPDAPFTDIRFGYVKPRTVLAEEYRQKYAAKAAQYTSFAYEIYPFYFSRAKNALFEDAMGYLGGTLELMKRSLIGTTTKLKLVYVPTGYETFPERWQSFRDEVEAGIRQRSSIRTSNAVEPVDVNALDWNLGEDRIRGLTRKLGIGFISLRPMIMTHGTYTEIYEDHFSKSGHRFVGEHLAQEILKYL